METIVGWQEADGQSRRDHEIADAIRPIADSTVKAWVTEPGRQVALAIDTTIYSLDVILRAAYKFTGDSFVFLSRKDNSAQQILAVFVAKDGSAAPELIGRFSNELLDQRLRESLDKQFGPLRTLIVAEAFAEGNLLDGDRDGGDYVSDPRGAGARR
jgi:His-Xaa-Ser system protein HxsD